MMNIGNFFFFFFYNKQEYYHLWNRNHSRFMWNNFIKLSKSDQSIYVSAERDYNAVIKETLWFESESQMVDHSEVGPFWH